MHKIAIKITDTSEIPYKDIALHLQRFIIEGDYRLSSIVELDVLNIYLNFSDN